MAPNPPPLNETEIRSRHIKSALAGIGLFKRAERANARTLATAAADTEIAAIQARMQEARSRIQSDLDERWHALCSNDSDVVVATLCEAYEDNEAPAAALGVEADEVTIVVLVPGLEVIPERMPQKTAAGNLTMPKLSRAARSDFYTQLVCGHVLATLRETFAVAPGIRSVRAAAIRLSEIDAYGKPHPECLLAGRFPRRALDGIQWATADAGRIVLDTSRDLLIRTRAQSRELLPLELSREPQLAALLDALDLDELAEPTHNHPSDSTLPQYSSDGQWWWDGERWNPTSQSKD